MSTYYPEEDNGFRFALCCLLFLIAVLLFGCKTQVITKTVETVRTEREVIRDTVITTEEDSAAIRALFECDSTNRVVLRELETMQGERIKPSVHIQHTDNGGAHVQFDCKEDSLRHEIELRDRIIEQMSKEVVEVPVRVRNGYDRFTSWGFWIFVVLLLIRVAWWAAKKYLKAQTGGML